MRQGVGTLSQVGEREAEGAFKRVFPEKLGDTHGFGKVEKAHGDANHLGWYEGSPEAEVDRDPWCCVLPELSKATLHTLK